MKRHLLLGLALLTIMVSAILALNAKSVASSRQPPKAKYTELLNANTGTQVSVPASILPETTISQEQEDAASVALPTSSPTQAIQRLTPPPGNMPYMNETATGGTNTTPTTQLYGYSNGKVLYGYIPLNIQMVFPRNIECPYMRIRIICFPI